MEELLVNFCVYGNFLEDNGIEISDILSAEQIEVYDEITDRFIETCESEGITLELALLKAKERFQELFETISKEDEIKL